MGEKEVKSATVSVDIPEQGISITFSNQDEAHAWFGQQSEFWNSIHERVGPTITMPSSGNISTGAFFREVGAIVSRAKNSAFSNDATALDDFISHARNLKLIIAGGFIEQAMTRDATSGTKEDLIGYLFAYCAPFWPAQVKERPGSLIPLAGALTSGNPTTRLLHMANDLQAASDSAQEINETKEVIDQKFSDWSKAFEELRVRYEAHISLKAPTTYWENRRKAARNIAIAAGITFVGLIAAMGYATYELAGSVLSFIESHSPALTIVHGLLFVIVPILAAAWILRHVSRVLVQNINNANDAAFRKALVETFLSIAQELKQGLAEQDRALIFNALFRPGPGEPHDEGPPVGVIDLLLKRQ